MATQAHQHGHLPTRASTHEGGYISDDDAIPANNPTNTTELLTERLQAWKHMCGYLENYISEVAKDQKSQSKDQDKILKTLSHPLKEGHHFDQSVGGVAGLFENLRANTTAQSNLHAETSKSLTGSVLPVLERLHSEIKNKSKELSHGAGKGSKAVDTARNSSQKHIELLGQHTASFDSVGSKPTAALDPYVIQKQVYHRLNKQLMEENSNRQDLIAVQNSFQSFEAHIIQTVQTAMNQYNQHMSAQADRQKAMYGDVAGTTGRIPADFEWQGFVKRNGHVLISPNAPSRSIEQVNFPNQNHRATKALIEGSLERKGSGLGALTGYKSGYFAVSPAGYLHEFKDNDNYRHDPTPEHSLFLRDCVIGAVDGVKFSVKGKDTSGSKLSQKMTPTSEYNFKAHTPQDAAEWHRVIASVTNATSNSLPTSPVSPVDQRQQIPHLNTGAAATGAGAGTIAAHQPMSATQQTPTSGYPTTAVGEKQPMSAGGAGQPMYAGGAGQPMSAGGVGHQMPAGGVGQPTSAGGAAPIGTAIGEGPGSVPHSATSATGPNTHYYSQPGQAPLEDRKY